MRLIVVHSVADVCLMKFKNAIQSPVPRDPLAASTTLGPLCSEAALLNLLVLPGRE